MKCDLGIWDEKDRKEAIKFFKSIGMEYFTNDTLEEHGVSVDIEFMNTPEVLKIYSLRENHHPTICKISAIGISFYLVVLDKKGCLKRGKGKLILENEKNTVDGTVFCPMSNIKTINALGALRYEENKKKINRKVSSLLN